MSGASFRERYGQWALITGASMGLGEAWARACAAQGVNVALVARGRERLEALCRELEAAHGVRTRAIPQDLTQPDAARRLLARTSDLEVGLLICNAAVSLIGPFLDQDPAASLAELDVNCRVPLLLTHALAPRMASRGRGGIVLMSSLSSAQGTARVTHYAATKSWNLILAEGLWHELRGRGVDVIGCVAGTVDTPGLRSSKPTSFFGAQAPAAVVSASFAALGKKPSVIPGLTNKLAGFAFRRLLPRRFTVRLMGGIMERMYPHAVQRAVFSKRPAPKKAPIRKRHAQETKR